MTDYRFYLTVVFLCWALMSCGQTVLNNSGGETWSTGTLVFGGSKIESGQDAAYYRAADMRFPVEENDTELYVQDPKNGRSHIFIHPFMGRLKTVLLSEKSYQLTGKINLPTEGNWKVDFIKHTAFQIKLDFTDEGWRLYDFTYERTPLPVNYPRLDSVRNVLENNTLAESKNWDLALPYFDVVKQYEYDLFTAVLAGDSTVLKEYLLLQRNYNIAYAGEFSEYFAGNIFYLLCLGIIGPEDLRAIGTYDDFTYLKRVYGNW
jgi:hypothetical protein